MFGGRAEFSGPTLESAKRAEAILHHAMASIFPELAATPIDYAWSGHVAFTRDQMPHAGRLDEAFYAGGYCGHGIAMATYLGSARSPDGWRESRSSIRCSTITSRRFRSTLAARGFFRLVGLYYRLLDWTS